MSEEAMSTERFTALADAYGAQIRRWPEHDRTAAGRFAKTQQGREILAAADELDALLDQYITKQPSAALRANILRTAEKRSAKRRNLKWGFGLAGVGIAGLLAGSIVTTIMAPSAYVDLRHQTFGINTTVFGDIAPGSDSSEDD